MGINQLRDELAHITIEGLSLIESGRRFDLLSLQIMCLHPETREKIFQTPEQVEEIRDKKVIEILLEELNAFRSAENMTDVRKKSEEPDFLASGESQKD